MPIQQRSLRNRYHTNNRKISGLWARNHFQNDLALNFSKKIGNVIAPRGGNCVTSTEDISMSVDERTTQQVCTLFIDCMKSLRTNLLTCKIFSETILYDLAGPLITVFVFEGSRPYWAKIVGTRRRINRRRGRPERWRDGKTMVLLCVLIVEFLRCKIEA